MTEIKIPVKAHKRKGSKGVKSHSRTIKVRDHPKGRIPGEDYSRDRPSVKKDQVVYAYQIDDFGRVEEVEDDKVIVERYKSPKYHRFDKESVVAVPYTYKKRRGVVYKK